MSKRLEGKRILVTRSAEQAPEMARLLEAEGAVVISVPTISIVPPQSWQPLDKALQKAPSYDWLILTSVNGVKSLARRLDKLEIAPALLRHLKVAAIGPATRQAAEELGLKVAVTPGEYVAEAVVAALQPETAGKKVLLVRAKVARDVIPQQLREGGAEVDVAEAYETVLPQASREKLRQALEEKPHVITFTSSSTVKNFISLLGQKQSPKQALNGVLTASIGPVTSATLRENGLSPHIEAREYTIAGLAEAIAAHLALEQ